MGLNKDGDELSILVDIDCLFDFRLKLLHIINKDRTKELLLSGKYTDRYYDAFDFIDPASFRGLYRDLINDLIYDAPLTPMLNFIIEYITETSHANLSLGASDNMVVYLNIHPMSNIDSKLIVKISEVLYSRLPSIVKLVVINKSNKELTVEWVKDNLAAMVKYDGLTWLSNQLATKEIVNNPISEIALFAPAIFMDKAPVNKKNYKKFLEDRASEYSYYIKMDFLSSKLFSLNL